MRVPLGAKRRIRVSISGLPGGRRRGRYSDLSASQLDPRRPERRDVPDAASAMVPRSSGTPTNVDGSTGDTLKSRFAHQVRHAQRAGEADAEPAADEHQAAAEDEAHDFAAARPERHAHANLLRPLAGGVGHHAVDADERERETEQAERAAEHRAHPHQEEAVRPLDHPVHRRHVEHRQVGIERVDLARDERRQRQRIAGRAQLQHAQRLVFLLDRHVEIAAGSLKIPLPLAVLHDADDFQPGVLAVRRAEALADRILVRPVVLRHELVDDRDAASAPSSCAEMKRPLRSRGLSVWRYSGVTAL